VHPPKDLYVPVLPQAKDGKLMFHSKKMTGTWTTVELQMALKKGYQITKIYAVAEYDRMNGPMKAYVNHFLQMKIENTRNYSQEECDEINREHHKKGFTFVIKPENTKKNPGMRQVAKICLNSLWGKFGQRPFLDNWDYIHSYSRLINMFWNKGNLIPTSWEIVSGSCVEVRYKKNSETHMSADYISEVTAAFTTANARMRLYAMLDWLDPSQVIYCDTDSVLPGGRAQSQAQEAPQRPNLAQRLEVRQRPRRMGGRVERG
jgi:hypothetical protein